jgi:phosphoribosylanthranilate isomerase
LMSPNVKICGLSDEPTLRAALEAGADLVGFVFFPASPRFVTVGRAARLASMAQGQATRVGLLVDADDAAIGDLLREVDLDMLQLHGKEGAARVAAIKARFGLPVMKALGVSNEADCARALEYAEAADQLLLDAKPPKGAARPGGNGVAFDWRLGRALQWRKPWLLSGGLEAANVDEALRQSGAPGVDVSSGVESAPGRKDVAKIRAFVRAAKSIVSPAA